MSHAAAAVDRTSPASDKIALFRSLFRGRMDVCRKTGRSGYAPACANEWVRGCVSLPRSNDQSNSVFVDDDLRPWADQWALSRPRAGDPPIRRRTDRARRGTPRPRSVSVFLRRTTATPSRGRLRHHGLVQTACRPSPAIARARARQPDLHRQGRAASGPPQSETGHPRRRRHAGPGVPPAEVRHYQLVARAQDARCFAERRRLVWHQTQQRHGDDHVDRLVRKGQVLHSALDEARGRTRPRSIRATAAASIERSMSMRTLVDSRLGTGHSQMYI